MPKIPRRRALAFWCVLTVLSASLRVVAQPPTAPNYADSAHLPALRMSHRQLASVVAKLRHLVYRANTGMAGVPAESLEVGSGNRSMTLTAAFDEQALRAAFSVADHVIYRYTLYDANVSSVHLWLSDGIRELKAEGAAREQVEAVVAFGSAELGQLWTIGGASDRLTGALLLVVVAWLLCGVGFFLTGWRRVASSVVGVGSSFSLWLPWDQWLPGVLVVPVEANWVTYYSPLITCVGTAVGLVAFTVELGRAAVRAQRDAQQAARKAARKGARSSTN